MTWAHDSARRAIVSSCLRYITSWTIEGLDPIGIYYLEKIQIPHLPALYGGGDDLVNVARFLPAGQFDYIAEDVVAAMLGSRPA